MDAKHVFVINPVAGKGKIQRTLRERITAAAKALGTTAEIYETKAPGDGTGYVKTLAGEQPVRVYACGGDGTLNGVINGAAGIENMSVGILPCGSGNDFVKMLPNPEKCADPAELMRAPAQDCDLLSVNGRRCVNMTNLGFDAMVVHRMGVFKHIPGVSGPTAYTFAVAASLISRMSYRMKVIIDGIEEIKGDYMLCAIGNGSVCGGKYRCLPYAKLDDGHMDLCLVKKVPRLSFPKLIGYYAAGTHMEVECLKGVCTYKQCDNIRITTDREAFLAVDGEELSGTDFTYTVLPKAQRIIMPE